MDRSKALSECYRVLKPGGILLISCMNMHSKFYLKCLRSIMKIVRFFYNKYNYESRALPRLGVGGKFDLLFFRTNKPQLYYYYPEEFLYEICQTGFNICEFFSSDMNMRKHPFLRSIFFYVSARKI